MLKYKAVDNKASTCGMICEDGLKRAREVEGPKMGKLTEYEFYVLLTVHLGIFLVNNQLDAQLFFFVCLFQFSTCFEQPCAHYQESQLYQYDIWYMSLCVCDRLVCRLGVPSKPAY